MGKRDCFLSTFRSSPLRLQVLAPLCGNRVTATASIRKMSAKPNGYWRVAATNTTDEKPARIAMIGAAW